jgi:hypothetical protein
MLVCCCSFLCWQQLCKSSSGGRASHRESHLFGAGRSAIVGRDFKAFWGTQDARKRIYAFIIAFLILLIVGALGVSDWAGTASALPLPGLFAFAILTVVQSSANLSAIRDTVFLGPILVIPFNFLLARAISHDLLTDFALIFLFLAVAATIAVVGATLLARVLDRRHWRVSSGPV